MRFSHVTKEEWRGPYESLYKAQLDRVFHFEAASTRALMACGYDEGLDWASQSATPRDLARVGRHVDDDDWSLSKLLQNVLAGDVTREQLFGQDAGRSLRPGKEGGGLVYPDRERRASL